MKTDTYLTRRQQEVVNLLVQGFTSKEIADQLRLKKSYIDGICFFLCAKFSCQNRAELVGYMLKNNLVTETV